ncbi:MAG: RadC family protein [Pelagimonas sp.]|uniref:RadC family protein n=1 Tax=Pelagimonas sp. TaxID=2073170 RepID=UPI003D6BA18C
MKSPKKPSGFGEKPARGWEQSAEAMRGLQELEARLPPPDIETKSAFAPSYAPNPKLSHDNAAGGGLVRDDRGNMVPSYWGHRRRLRDRFLSGGHEPMPEYELLELLLFNAIERIDVKPLAKRLLAAFGDLNGVVAAPRQLLLQVEGATEKVFLQLRIAEAFAHRMSQARMMDRDVLSSSEALLKYCKTRMAHRDTEQFRVIYLDRKNMVIADESQGEGTVDHVPVYPREVIKRAFELNATAMILVHNHPSGDPTPSEADIIMTDELVDVCKVVGLSIHDHLVIGKERDFSFRGEGLI